MDTEALLSVEELQALDARIRANADALIAKAKKVLYTPSEKKSGKKPASFTNLIAPEVSHCQWESDEKWPLWLDDPVSGVARLDWNGESGSSRPLSKSDIVKCLGTLEEISVESVSKLLVIGERQARRYYKACELLHDRLVDNFCDDDIRLMRYPETFIYPKRGECPDIRQTDIWEE